MNLLTLKLFLFFFILLISDWKAIGYKIPNISKVSFESRMNLENPHDVIHIFLAALTRCDQTSCSFWGVPSFSFDLACIASKSVFNMIIEALKMVVKAHHIPILSELLDNDSPKEELALKHLKSITESIGHCRKNTCWWFISRPSTYDYSCLLKIVDQIRIAIINICSSLEHKCGSSVKSNTESTTPAIISPDTEAIPASPVDPVSPASPDDPVSPVSPDTKTTPLIPDIKKWT